MEQKQPQYQLISITTTESFFKREAVISDDDYKKTESAIDLNVAKSFDKDEIGVFVTVDLKQELKGKILVEIKITTVGLFKKNVDDPQISIENFCDINAPAIIFPFIRENIANLSMRGGLQPIIIQPINFVELNKKNKEPK